MTTRADLRGVTQVAYPWKAALRTAVQVGIPTVLTLAVVLPSVVEILLDELGEQLPESLRLWLLGAAGLITAGAAALTRVMAIPGVNEWLTGVGLGATPRGDS